MAHQSLNPVSDLSLLIRNLVVLQLYNTATQMSRSPNRNSSAGASLATAASPPVANRSAPQVQYERFGDRNLGKWYRSPDTGRRVRNFLDRPGGTVIERIPESYFERYVAGQSLYSYMGGWHSPPEGAGRQIIRLRQISIRDAPAFSAGFEAAWKAQYAASRR